MISIRKHFLSLLLFYLCTIILNAQNKKIDSLTIELEKYKVEDSLRVNLLMKIVHENYKKEYENNISYLNEAETISKNIGYKKGIAWSLFYRGIITSIKTKYNSGYEYYEEAISIYKELNLYSKVYLCYKNLSIYYTKNGDYNRAIYFRKQCIETKKETGDKNIENDLFYVGWYYYRMGAFDKCISYYNEALLISKRNNNYKTVQDCLTAIGNLYSHQGNYPLALEYLNEALNSAKESNETKNISDALVSLGNVYIRLQNYDKAIVLYKKALVEENHDNYGTIAHNLGESYKFKKEYNKAFKFFKDALEVYREKYNRPDEATTLNKIGEIYLEQNNIDEAFLYFEKAKNINTEISNQRGLCGSYLGLIKIYLRKGNYNIGLKYALICKKIATKLELLDIQRDVEQLLFNIYRKTDNYKKALESHEKFKLFNDSIFNKENIEKITQLEYEYKYKQALDSASIRELKLTKTVLDTSQSLKKSQRNLLLGVIGFLVTSLVLGAIIFILRLRNEKAKTQNVMIEQKLLRSQMTPHFIFNSLSVLQGMILNKEEKKSVSYVSKFSKLLRTILENSRDKVVLLSQELVAIENYLALQNLENNKLVYTILVENTIHTSLFKIPPMLIQPFVENAVEHAFVSFTGTRIINIEIAYVNEDLVCIIKDNGVGVNYIKEGENLTKKSLSTTITAERLKILSKDFKRKGSVIIEDRKKYNELGTIVTLILPYIKLQSDESINYRR